MDAQFVDLEFIKNRLYGKLIADNISDSSLVVVLGRFSVKLKKFGWSIEYVLGEGRRLITSNDYLRVEGAI